MDLRQEDVPRLLRGLRWYKRWTQRDFARAAGVAESAVSEAERGVSMPTPETLDRLLAAAEVTPERVGLFLERLGAIEAALAGGEAAGPERWAMAVARRAEAFERAAWALRPGAERGEPPPQSPVETAEAARSRALELFRDLMAFPPACRRAAAIELTVFHHWALAERLGEASIVAAAHSEEGALELAGLALEVACRTPGPASRQRPIEAHAWAHLGNARRVAGDLPAAEAAFRQARSCWPAAWQGPAPGPLASVRLLDLELSLRNDQRRLDEAGALADLALEWASSDVERQRLLIKKAYTLELTGDAAGALALLDQARACGDMERAPRAEAILLFNRAANLCQLGRAGEAERLLPEIDALSARAGRGLDRLRLRWLEGRVHAGLGRLAVALEALEEVRQGFAARRIPFDIALATLEQAALWAELGRPAAVKALARDLPPLFAALGVARETLAALTLFCQAAEAEAATAAMARRLIERLERGKGTRVGGDTRVPNG